ncbi:unnamed protein product [Bursaphelenchus okinawaensis]|uniref:Uncharacterized protein n=1 Tax=Bursaphelenchus okinawaensis TaxID=465554 RepID=A0A811K8W1_9BILA|nr:unnamed protein product [Bursaphelenchus okinawaensis]CAG9094473.1 unnamed protein product [Bursaphelenchus okinawaensis]
MPFELDYTGPTDSVKKFLPSNSKHEVLFRGVHIEPKKVTVPEDLHIFVCKKENETSYTVESEANELTVWNIAGESCFENHVESALKYVKIVAACAAED